MDKTKTVRIISDNENYIDFMDKVLVITHVATNTNQHPGYDDAMEGEPLFDLETEDGEEVPFSLYEYEIEYV
jgi:hypothetical protein